jgi:hypothetical protein
MRNLGLIRDTSAKSGLVEGPELSDPAILEKELLSLLDPW